LVNLLPSEIWPRLRSTLLRNGIPAELADGERGVIESVWVKFTDDEESSHRFRFTVTPGIALDSTEVSVLHQSVARGAEEGAEWPQSSDIASREQALVQMIAGELANTANYSSVSLLAQTIGGKGRVELVLPEVADPYIVVQLNFDRSWASLSYSAQRGGFTIVDQNRSAGTLLVDFNDSEGEQRSFWQRWFGSDEQLLSSDYQIVLKAVGGNVEVRIVALDGSSLARKEAQRLLQILRGNMT
jgi:outer membrane protein assembly factor BamC